MPWGTFQCPSPCSEPLLTHASTVDPLALAGSFDSVSCVVTALLFWVLVHIVFCLCLPRLKFCFSQSSESLIIKSHQPVRPDSLRIPSPFVRSPVWGAWCMVQNLQNSGRSTLILFFSSAWVMHLVDIGFDLILIVPLLPPSCSFFFVFGCGVSFFGGFQHPSVSGCSISS